MVAKVCDWANKCSPGNNMAFNKGIGYDSGASVPLGYCLEICLIVDGDQEGAVLLGLLVVSIFMCHSQIALSLMWSKPENHIPKLKF